MNAADYRWAGPKAWLRDDGDLAHRLTPVVRIDDAAILFEAVQERRHLCGHDVASGTWESPRAFNGEPYVSGLLGTGVVATAFQRLYWPKSFTGRVQDSPEYSPSAFLASGRGGGLFSDPYQPAETMAAGEDEAVEHFFGQQTVRPAFRWPRGQSDAGWPYYPHSGLGDARGPLSFAAAKARSNAVAIAPAESGRCLHQLAWFGGWADYSTDPPGYQSVDGTLSAIAYAGPTASPVVDLGDAGVYWEDGAVYAVQDASYRIGIRKSDHTVPWSSVSARCWAILAWSADQYWTDHASDSGNVSGHDRAIVYTLAEVPPAGDDAFEMSGTLTGQAAEAFVSSVVTPHVPAADGSVSRYVNFLSASFFLMFSPTVQIPYIS